MLSNIQYQAPSAKVLALQRGVEWESWKLAGRAEMVSAAMNELGMSTFATERGLDWDSLSPSAQEGLINEARIEWSQRGTINNRTKATEACAQKIAHSKGRDWDSMWTLTQEFYRNGDEVETGCHNCYVGGSAPQTQKDAFHNLLTGAVRHLMGEDYWGDWTVD